MKNKLIDREIELFTMAQIEMWSSHTDLVRLKNIIDEEPKILEKVQNGKSLLSVALLSGTKKTVDLILSYNPNLAAQTENSYLFHAKYLPQCFHYFLEKGVNLKNEKEELELSETHPSLFDVYLIYKEKAQLDTLTNANQVKNKLKL
jgi:hypothetical protein